jgi:hypothetical protein
MFLTEGELPTYYPKSGSMPAVEVARFLARANAYAHGVIGGIPPTVDDSLKAAVSLAFEILAKDEDAQVDEVNGNITAAAPSGYFARREKDPLEVVKTMLLPYAAAYDQANTQQSEKGMQLL